MSRRRMRTHAEWNVDTHIFLATGPDQRLDALAHLVGGLVGERDGEDAERADALLLDEVGDAMGEHPGLARAGAGDDQQRSLGVHDRVELVGVELGGRHGRPILRPGWSLPRAYERHIRLALVRPPDGP